MLSFKPTFSLSSFTFIKRLFSSSSFSAIKGGVICISEVIDISPSNLDSSLCFIQPSISHQQVRWFAHGVFCPRSSRVAAFLSVSKGSAAPAIIEFHASRTELFRGKLPRALPHHRSH